MQHKIELQPGQTKIKERWLFECRLTANSPPRCNVRAIVADPELKAPRLQKGQEATILVLPMSPSEALQLALAISEALTTAKIPLPAGVLVQSDRA